MKITRVQLRKLIQESVYGTGKKGYSKTRPDNPIMHMKPDVMKKLEPLTKSGQPDYLRQAYDLATMAQPDMTVFPNDGDPYTRKPYEGDDYFKDLEKSKFGSVKLHKLQLNLKNACDAIKGKPLEGKLLDDCNDARNLAWDYAMQVANDRGLKSVVNYWERRNIYNKLFGPFLPKD